MLAAFSDCSPASGAWRGHARCGETLVAGTAAWPVGIDLGRNIERRFTPWRNMMSINVSEFVWKRLQEWGLKRVYGYPGDGVGGLDVALQKALPDMEYVQVRHEEMAAFMASAHAKFTGGVGLCYATSGPGAIHLLNGLYDAKMDNQPVVAIVGQQARSALGAHYQQEVDLVSLFKDVASDYVAIGTVPEPGAAHGGPGCAHRSEQAFRHLHYPAQRSATDALRGSAARARHNAYGRGFPAESKVPRHQRPAGGSRSAEQGQEGRHAGRRRLPRSD